LAVLLGIFFCTIQIANAATLTGQVLAVHTGNRITLATPSDQLQKVQLIGIKAPSTTTHQGRLSRKYLHMLLAGKFVKIVYDSLAPDGMILGQVLHGGVDMNKRMLEAGQVQVDTQAEIDASLLTDYLATEKTAQRRGFGLWAKSLKHN